MVRGAIMALALAAASAISGHTSAEHAHMLSNGLQSAHFARSGGMLGMTISGDVVITGSTPELRADGRTRPLTDQEQTLFASLDHDRLRQSRFLRGAHQAPPPVPDTFQYSVRLDFQSGSVELAFPEQPGQHLAADDPSVTGLAAWVAGETRAILERRAAD